MSDCLLGDIANIQTGPFGSQLHSEDYVQNNGTPIVTVEHLGNRKFTRQNLPLVSNEDKARLSKYAMRPGDIIFSRVGSVDRCSYALPENDGWLFSGRCLRVRCREGVDPAYLYAYLSSAKVKSYIRNIAVGATMPSINTSLMSEVPVTLPSSKAQQAIGELMAAFDSKIELNSQINDYLAELLDTKFDRIFQDDNSLSEASLLDIANYKNGLAMQKFRPKIGDPGLPVLKIRELRRGCCGQDSERCQSDIDEAFLVHDGDLVFSWSGTLLLDFWAGGDAGLNQHLFKVTSAAYPNWFYYMWTKYHLRKFIAMAKDRATTMGHIKRSALADSKVLIPERAVLDGLTKSMQPIVDQMILNKIENRQLSDLRNALFPKLMSGKIDVSKVDLTLLNNHLS